MASTTLSTIPTLTQLYAAGKLTPPAPDALPPPTLNGPSSLPTPSASLNDRVSLLVADITTLRVDAIVNAANRSLLGGGGVDGAIHRAAGPGLFGECLTLNGCATGSAKMTDAYRLPCRKVIHAVGPIYQPYDAEACELKLSECYTRSLELAAAAGCRSIAFSALSTGIYGYPAKAATATALAAIREFLEKGEGRETIDRVVIVVWMAENVLRAYHWGIPLFFPPVPEGEETKEEAKKGDEVTDPPEGGTEAAKSDPEAVPTEEQLEAEAQAVAKVLPDAPTSDPVDVENKQKKQKLDE